MKYPLTLEFPYREQHSINITPGDAGGYSRFTLQAKKKIQKTLWDGNDFDLKVTNSPIVKRPIVHSP